MFPKMGENTWQKVEGTGVRTHDLLPIAHMVNHCSMNDCSYANGHGCINGVLVKVLTNGHGKAILQMKVTNFRSRKKKGKRKRNLQGVKPEI